MPTTAPFLAALVALAACGAGADRVADDLAAPPQPAAQLYPAGAFAIPDPQLAGWQLEIFDHRDGLGFRVVGGTSPYSLFEIGPSCLGDCVRTPLTEQIANQAHELARAIEDTTQPIVRDKGCASRWVRRLGELRPGVWAFDAERGGQPVCREEVVEVDYVDPRVTGEFLRCGATLYGNDVVWGQPLMELCAHLSYQVGEASDPLAELFAHRMRMLDSVVEIPSLDGWRLQRWNANNGFTEAELIMGSIAGTSDASVRRYLCRGCDAHRAIEEITTVRRVARVTPPAQPLPEIADHIWFERYAEHGIVVMFGATLSSKQPGYVTCDAVLKLGDIASADRVEAFCRSVLQRWHDDPKSEPRSGSGPA